MRRILAAALLALAVLAVWQQAASAHPLGNFTVNRYSRIEVAPEGVRLRYVLDLAEIPTLQELSAVGLDQSASVEAVRARLLGPKGASLAAGAKLRVAGRDTPWTLVSATLDLLPGQAGLSTLRVVLDLSSPERVPDGAALDYRDENYPGRTGWHEIVLAGSGGVGFSRSTVPASDQSDELRRYPTDAAVPPIDVTSASATVRYGATAAADPGGATPSIANVRFAIDRGVDELTGYLRGGPLDLRALLAALVVAAALGGLHALGPGHGKAVVAAYLVGSRGTARHAILLGATVTVTHTAGVFALGLVTLVAAQYILPEKLYPVLGVLSGLLVVAVGVSLARSRISSLRAARRRGPHPEAHSAAPHSHPGQEHSDHGHPHSHDRDPGALGLRSLVGLGVSGGLLPCPTALVVLLAAVSFHNVVLGMTLVLAFSVGLAAVLTGIGLLMVGGGRRLSRSSLSRRLSSSSAVLLLPALSAGVIAIAGIVIAVDAVRGF